MARGARIDSHCTLGKSTRGAFHLQTWRDGLIQIQLASKSPSSFHACWCTRTNKSRDKSLVQFKPSICFFLFSNQSNTKIVLRTTHNIDNCEKQNGTTKSKPIKNATTRGGGGAARLTPNGTKEGRSDVVLKISEKTEGKSIKFTAIGQHHHENCNLKEIVLSFQRN